MNSDRLCCASLVRWVTYATEGMTLQEHAAVNRSIGKDAGKKPNAPNGDSVCNVCLDRFPRPNAYTNYAIDAAGKGTV